MRRFLLVCWLGWFMATPVWSEETAPIQLVTSFSILADMARQVGGDRVVVHSLIGANEDSHVYQPKPSDARVLAAADLVVVNGLGFESWFERLLQASGYQGPIIVATEGIQRLSRSGHDQHAEEDGHHDEHEHHGEDHHEQDHADAGHGHDHRASEHHEHDHAGHEHDHDHDHHDHGAFDPHAWQSLVAAQVYVDNILQGLIAVDPDHAAEYRARAADYQRALQALLDEFKPRFEALPADKRRVMVSHAAFHYLGQSFNLEFVSPQGISSSSEPSAAEMGQLIRQIRERQVGAIFVENISDPRLVEQLRRETGLQISGTLYSDALSESTASASTYLQLMRHNLQTLLDALGN